MFRVSGYTENKSPVIAGVYQFSATYGVPLDLMAIIFRDKGWVIDILSYVKDGLNEGEKLTSLVAKLESITPSSSIKELKNNIVKWVFEK